MTYFPLYQTTCFFIPLVAPCTPLLTELLQKCGAKQSFSATARPHDNAVAEAFFASFKKEEAYRREYTSEQSYRKSVAQYVQFYNELRPHRTLKYKTPQAFEEAYWASLS